MKTVFLLLCAAAALTGVVPKFPSLTTTRCSAGWTQIGGRCFIYVAAKLKWSEAEEKCVSMKANLVSVHSTAEYNSIHSLIRRSSTRNDRTWIGGTDCQMEQIWLWSDGTAFDYPHCGRFDNRKKKQHCLQMNTGGKSQ
ncbi:galactose-specific lectin nattectin [Pleuronectes platessa]|uniref:galactose-specific lectin nattectin n=1 Tax=Pleuronectes platessa TaxID=8262 RepID=UPI00232A6548|nr:galactose-specific lectin nattectin [Pleuronectes platessa]